MTAKLTRIFMSRIYVGLVAVAASGATLVGAGDADAASLHWSRPAQIAPSDLTSISCPSSSLCVATAPYFGLVISTSPANGAGSWTTVSAPATQPVSCPPHPEPSPSGPSPSGPPPSGPVACPQPAPSPFSLFSPQAVSCPSTTLCVAVGSGYGGKNEALVSTDPAAGAAAWTAIPIDGRNGLDSISCSSASACVALSTKGLVLSTTNPTGGPGAWRSTDIYPYQPHATPTGALSCVPGLCAIASNGGGGGVVTATRPKSGVGAWTGADLDSIGGVSVVACASKRLCITSDGYGIVYSSATPARSDVAWHADRTTYPTGDPYTSHTGWATSATCSPGGFCAIGKGGVVLTSSHPLGRGWHKTRIDDRSFAISCPSNHLCVAVDRSGRVITGG